MIDVKPNLQTLVRRAEDQFFPWITKWSVESLVIQTDEQLKNANDLLGIGKAIHRDLEEARKEEKRPILEQAEAVDDKYKPIKNRIALGVSLIDKAVLTYHDKKKKEADALLLMQMQEEAPKMAECRTTGEVYEAPEAIVKPVTNSVRGNMSSTAIIEGYEYEIIDPDAVPRELCSPDLKKIKAKHKYDKLPIPGVLITAKSHTSTRLG
ncbi:MAG: hypothetical protein PHI12_08675 [Dehalococcoidales bacterium]|nr:hypothetical protein [Dehalococcoidales bacterium]